MLALLAAGGDGARARDLRQLGDVCLAIAAGRPIEALARLDTVAGLARDPGRGRAGPAAQPDLRPGRRPRRARTVPTGTRSGSPPSAATGCATVYVDGVAARLDAQELRRTAAPIRATRRSPTR